MRLLTITFQSDRPALPQIELPVPLQVSPITFLKMTCMDVGRALTLSINREMAAAPDAETRAI